MANRVDYNYQDIVDKVTEILSDKEGWGDAYQTSMGQTLIQLIADATDTLHYMQERRSREAYLPTASLRSSILARASERGYRPRRNVSSSGQLKIRLVDDDGVTVVPEGNITIPRYTEFFYDDYIFVNIEDIFITPDDYEIEFNVIEGRPQSETYDPNSGSFQQNGHILLEDYDQIEENSLVVIDSEEEEWFDVREPVGDNPPLGALSFAGPQENFYDIRIAVDGMRIVFGNGTFGRRPSNEITVEWVQSSGSDLNIQREGVEFAMEVNELQDDINVTPPNTYQYEVVNITPIRGGLPAESIEDIQLKAPEYFKTGDRAVTKYDFDHFIIRSGIGGIVDVNTYGEQELGLNIERMNHLFAAYLTADGQQITTEQLDQLRDYINRYQVAIPHLSLDPAERIYCQYNLKIAKNSKLRVSEPEVYKYVREQIANRFEFEEGSIGKPFYFSGLVRFLDNLTIVRDGLEQPISRYISLDVNPAYQFEAPFEENEVVVHISVGNDQDNYILTIDPDPESEVDLSATYAYQQQEGDDAQAIIDGLVTSINGDYATEVDYDEGTLTILADDEESFYITNEESTNVDNIRIMQTIQVPPRLLNNRFDEDMIVRGSISIVDEQGNEQFVDDGDGNIGMQGSVNYVDAVIEIPLLSTGTYYVRYQEDEFSNIKPNERTVVTVLNPKENIDDTVETLSTIEFMD